MYLCKWRCPPHCKYGPLHRSVDCFKGQNWPRTVICELRSIAWHRRGGGGGGDGGKSFHLLTCFKQFLFRYVECGHFTQHEWSWLRFVYIAFRASFLACRAKVFRSPNRYGLHSFSYGQRRQSCQGRNHSETLARTWTDRCRTTTAPWWGNTRERRCPRQQRFV